MVAWILASFPVDYVNKVLTEREAARELRCSQSNFRRICRARDGPPRIRLGKRRVGYVRLDLLVWRHLHMEKAASPQPRPRKPAVNPKMKTMEKRTSSPPARRGHDRPDKAVAST